MKRIKLILAMVAAMMVMVALGAAPAMASHLDADDCIDAFDFRLVGVADRCLDHDRDLLDSDFLVGDVAREHVGPPHRIGNLVCFRVRDKDVFGNTIERFWECITPEGDVIEI